MRVQRSLSAAGSNGALSPAPSSTGTSVPELTFPAPPPGTAFMSTYSIDVAAIEPEPEKPVSVTQSLDEEEDESTIYLGSPKVRACSARWGAARPAGCCLLCARRHGGQVRQGASKISHRQLAQGARLGLSMVC